MEHTESGLHAQHTVELVPQGANIFVEKPMALTLNAAALDTIRKVEGYYCEQEFGLESGSPVCLIEGPFKGLCGFFKRSEDHVEILLTLIGQQSSILVPLS